jgi:hypothetical protein
MQAGKKYDYTPHIISERALSMALAEVAFALTGKHLSKVSLCILLAQMAQEQGVAPNGERKFPNFNGFGIKALPGQDYFESPTKEGFGATEVSTRAKFRHFGTLEDALRGYVSLLSKQPRYAKAWASLEEGDYDGFVVNLGPHKLLNGKQDPNWGGYFTGDPVAYITGVRRHWAHCALRSVNYGTTPDQVRVFQATHPEAGKADGLIGPKTRAALKAALGV